MAPNKPKVTDQVRTIGRKVRARLDEEVKNRREIQRVEPSSQAPEGKSNVVIEIPKLKKPPVTPKQQARKRRAKVLAVDEINRSIDPWMPLIDHIQDQQSDSTDNSRRSSLVQLHGLPIGVTGSQIRRFFSGLRIQRLILLPSFESTVQELDAIPTSGKKPTVERYEASALRSFVKFESVAIASSAVQRSGEVLRIDDIGVSIRLTVVAKAHADVLQRVLAVNCPLQDSQPIHDVVQRLELDVTVSGVLWAEVVHTLKLTVTTPTELDGPITFPIFPRHEQVSFQLSQKQVDWLRECRENLSKFVSELRDRLPFPSAEYVDPSIDDPLLKLNVACVEILRKEITMIDRHLLVASKWNILISS